MGVVVGEDKKKKKQKAVKIEQVIELVNSVLSEDKKIKRVNQKMFEVEANGIVFRVSPTVALYMRLSEMLKDHKLH